MAKERKTITVTKPNQQAKMGVTVTKTGYSPIFVSGLTTNGVGASCGLLLNDVVVAVNGTRVDTPVQCTDLFKSSVTLDITVEREVAPDTKTGPNIPTPSKQQETSPATPPSAPKADPPKAKADPPKPKAAATKAAPAAASPAAASQNPFKKCFARCCVPKPQQ